MVPKRATPLNILKSFVALAVVVAMLAVGFASVSDVDNQADVNHPDIHQKVGNENGRANANPNGNGNGGQIHGIANTPGQEGTNPNDDGTAGFANELETVHGGIGDVNPQVD